MFSDILSWVIYASFTVFFHIVGHFEGIRLSLRQKRGYVTFCEPINDASRVWLLFFSFLILVAFYYTKH